MSFIVASQIGFDLTGNDSVPTQAVGARYQSSTGVFCYGKSATDIAAGQLCWLSDDGDYIATITDTNDPDFPNAPATFCVAQSDQVADKWGWFFIGWGLFTVFADDGTDAEQTLCWSDQGPGAVDVDTARKINAKSVTDNNTGDFALITAYAPTSLQTSP